MRHTMKMRIMRALFALVAIPLGVLGAPLQAHPGIDEQIEHLTAAIEHDPQDANLFLRRGELYRIHRDSERAEADYRTARRLDPGLHIVDFCLGRLKLETGHPREAKQLLDRYVSHRPNDPDGLATRGRSLAELGHYLAAAEDFTTALEHPRNGAPKPGHYLERARALQAAGPEHVALALEGLDEGLERLRQPITLQLFAVELELARKNYEGALGRLDLVASQSVRQEPWLMRKAAILEAAGRLEEARGAYRQALQSIDTLPTSRRGSKAVSRLEEEARSALRRLNAGNSVE